MAFELLWLRMSVWLALIIACAFGGIAAVLLANAYVAGALLIASAFGLVFVLDAVLRTQQNEIARFVDAVRFSDLSQTFSGRAVTRRLATSMNSALARLRETTAARDADTVLLRALYEHAPVAVFAIGPRGEMQMMNLAARRLLGPESTDRMAALHRLSPELAGVVAPNAKAGRALVRTPVDGRTMRLVVTSSSLHLRGSVIRIVSVQNIESELGGAEFDAWRDLIRVLTHEIMNTLTPVASLAQLLQQLSGDMTSKLGEAKEAGDVRAINAEIASCAESLSARAQSLLRFVDAYRVFTRLPPPQPTEVALAPLLQRLKLLFEGGGDPKIALSVEPDLRLVADAGQLEQALLNLITNAREAQIAAGVRTPIVVEATEDQSGSIAISVKDSGAGISEDVRERIFTPFFSTKKDGSGVGLSLVRQIALAHGGSVDFSPRAGGASFTIVLPVQFAFSSQRTASMPRVMRRE
jgi:two-component system, NtrC family, nitrogen regulation sensor histidine kinase NtrY